MSPLDNRPHVVIVYSDDSSHHEDGGRWASKASKVIGPFPTAQHAEAVHRRLRAYLPSSIDTAVEELERPLDEDAVEELERPLDEDAVEELERPLDEDAVAHCGQDYMAGWGQDHMAGQICGLPAGHDGWHQ